MTPARIQRRRSKGWRMPAGAIYVGRPGKFGNPWDWRTFGREVAVDLYRRWLDDEISSIEKQALGFDVDPAGIERARRQILDGLEELRGHDLCCWCGESEPFCHADVLLEKANPP